MPLFAFVPDFGGAVEYLLNNEKSMAGAMTFSASLNFASWRTRRRHNEYSQQRKIYK